ncbi:methylmalonyl Co-A mutase-associated GTPase MeaB [Geomonas sp.]|uniref:methylmalonyl Co-A mutase-associated GTPase MeaB n=1 Tax=Geomonas sp. TaxID=2651584 RepID=UPI002B46F7FD|nr:methylmalonyl Co-A mutase-associated GTPase MeaB [Geomonas sp.]HJV35852.1 methylmalonyl Co-A mutase-associated GTPase MeaB [Geomonas sp.]
MAERRLRVLVGKPGLDGHDRGAKTISRAFRDAGFEVIYLGVRQTPEQIVSSAIQEDVDLIALSILSDAYHTHLPAVNELLKQRKSQDIAVIVGGVIAEADVPALKQAGARGVFTPGTPTDAIVAWIHENVTGGRAYGYAPPGSLAQHVLEGDLRGAGRLMRDLDDGLPDAIDQLQLLHPHTGNAHLVAVAGPAGAGKSTLIDRLVAAYREKDLLVGVVAISPSSSRSGGAILGDRIRLNRYDDDAGVFVRSLATRGAKGGVSRSTWEVVGVLDAMGMDVIIIETAGCGHDEVEIHDRVHTTVLVTIPGLGDDVEAMEAGLLEMGDILVVNKADLAGADAAIRELAAMLELPQAEASAWRPPVLGTQGTDGAGIEQLFSALESHREYLKVSGALQQRNRERLAGVFADALRDRLLDRVLGALKQDRRYRQLLDDLQKGSTDPSTAARELAERAFP